MGVIRLSALLLLTSTCSAGRTNGVDLAARVSPPATSAARAPAVPRPSLANSVAATPARAEELDPLEPEVSTPGEIWSDAPQLAPAACPHEPLPKQQDAACSRQRGLAALASALEGPSLPEAQSACPSPWDAEFASVRRAASPREMRKQRDRRLARLETCAGLDAGLVRLTRVALWTECADALAVTVSTGTLTAAMRGYATAARIDRLSFEPPSDLASRPSERAVQRAITWTEEQAKRLRSAARAVNGLAAGTHGRAIAQLALGHGWTRLLHTRYDLPLVSAAERSAQRDSLNTELARYLGEGTELEARAADAAQIATEWPLLRAWQAGQRPGPVEATLALVLPALPGFQPRGVRARLAASLPSYVAAHLLADEPLDSALLRALLERGLDPKLRRTLAAQSRRSDESQLFAHARTVLAARALAPAQAAAAVVLLRGNTDDDAQALSAVASSLARLPAGLVNWSAARGLDAPAQMLLAAASRSRSPWSAALLGYDAFRLESASLEPSPGLASAENQAHERAGALGPALSACLPRGPVMERGCACPALKNLY